MEKDTLAIIHEESLKCLKVFASKCEENHLTYWMFYGGLIGCIRHNGFIPWDDDIDIAMPRKDYESFISLYKDFLSEDYFLENYQCPFYENYPPNCRINMKHLLLRKDKQDKEYYFHAFVSIFPVDGMPNHQLFRWIHFYFLRFLYYLLRVARSSINGVDAQAKRGRLENVFVWLNKKIGVGRALNPRKMAALFNHYLMKYDYSAKEYCRVGHLGTILYSEDFSKTTWHSFEGIEVPIPAGYDRCLRMLYGNYMELPPEEERVPQHGIEVKFV